MFFRPKVDSPLLCIRDDLLDSGGTVDVPLYKMPIQSIPHAKCPLEIEHIPGLVLAEVCFLQRLVNHIEMQCLP